MELERRHQKVEANTLTFSPSMNRWPGTTLYNGRRTPDKHASPPVSALGATIRSSEKVLARWWPFVQMKRRWHTTNAAQTTEHGGALPVTLGGVFHPAITKSVRLDSPRNQSALVPSNAEQIKCASCWSPDDRCMAPTQVNGSCGGED